MFGGNNSSFKFLKTSLKLVDLFSLYSFLLELFFGRCDQLRTKSEIVDRWRPDPTESVQVRLRIQRQPNPDLRPKSTVIF